MVTEEQLKERYEKFLEFVKADERADKLLAMYEDFSTELTTHRRQARHISTMRSPAGILTTWFV